MKRLRKIKNQVVLHPIMSFLILTFIVILLSGILDVFDVSVNYNRVNAKTGNIESVLVTVESLFNLSGLKYIFSNTVSNFVSFAPLSMLLILLIGISIMDRSGFLDTLFFIVTRRMPKYLVTFIFTVLCILVGTTGDITFIVMIPLAALLFKYGKRNPVIGIIHSFASIGLGVGLHIFISSTDSSLINTTIQAANIISTSYNIHTFQHFYIMIPAMLIGSIILTYVTEKITAPSLAKFEVDENEVIEDKDSLSRREVRGLLFAAFGAILYLIVFIYNIIPKVPFGGNLLDYSQVRYIDKLFGTQSFFNSGYVFVITFLFFICGFLYGIGAKKISNHRELCDYLSHSLDDIGKIIVVIFFASTFISLLKYSNIGELVTAFLANVIAKTNFTGLPLVFLVFIVSGLSALLLPSLASRWQILSTSLVSSMMTSGFTPEMAQLVFTVGSSIAYMLTPVMAYYVIYLSYIEKYNKDGIGMRRSIYYLLPYAIGIMAMWVLLLILWYVIKLPLGINTGIVI